MSAAKIGAALVVGGGIGGMQASLDLAAAGIKVYLLDEKPSIGGAMAQLDKTFPTNDCAMCTMAPRLVEIGRHKDIELLTLGSVAVVEGGPGDFRVTIDERARYVDTSLCTGCGSCVAKCPKTVPNLFNAGLNKRHAIDFLFPQAVPNKPSIDRDNCLYFKTGKCRLCEKACQAHAIDFGQKDGRRTLEVGAVILAPGFELFDARAKEGLGFGRHANVVSSLAFERLLSPSGPNAGKILRPSDNKAPGRIAFIQCVGSRDAEHDYCSSVCCMYATKEALIAREHMPGLECDIFFMDLRAYGKNFEEYYQRAKAEGVNYIRCRIPVVGEGRGEGNLRIDYLEEGDLKRSRDYDLVVLSVGMKPPAKARELAERFGVELNEAGFCRTSPLRPSETSRPGIFVAGAFAEPKDIPDTVTQASGAASRVIALLGESRGSLIASREYPAETDTAGQEPRIGVFVCHCGTNIASVVDVAAVVEYAKTLPGVVYAENELYACANDTQQKLKAKIGELGLNRFVVASCTPRTHEALFGSTIREAGLNPYLFELANIREQCAWVHPREPEAATRKAKDLVRIAVSKARLDSPLYPRLLKISNSALVIGGGITGLTAALDLAAQGFSVHIVEKRKILGGRLRTSQYLLDGSSLREHLDNCLDEIANNNRIHVYTSAVISGIQGSVGNFRTTLSIEGREMEIEHGAVIVAVGAKEHRPEEYLYGLDERVITQGELETRLGQPGAICGVKKDNTVVMIQCVGSRDEKRPYCSRVCCSEAVKNALAVKERCPETNVFVLYRDMRTYGFREAYYTKAREKGVVFLRYDEDSKPEVSPNGGGLAVRVLERTVGREVAIAADLVVLSAGLVQGDDTASIAGLLRVPLNANGFFLEAHMKLRPVDFASEGVFVCGSAHFPKSVEESMAQAHATAARAATILSKDTIEIEPTISRVNEDKCDGCAYCVDPCPYKAITLVEYEEGGKVKKRVVIDEAVCKGCGTCMATCPKDAVNVRHFELDKLRAEVFAALEVEG